MYALIDMTNLIVVRMWCTVSSDKSVATEIRVVVHTHKAHVTAISPDIVTEAVFPGKGLVYPVPDKTSLQAIITADDSPIVVEVAFAVTHGMLVFAEDEGTAVTLVGMAPACQIRAYIGQ